MSFRGAGLLQQICDLRVPLFEGDGQRRLAVAVLSVDVRAGSQQSSHDTRRVAIAGGGHQGRIG